MEATGSRPGEKRKRSPTLLETLPVLLTEQPVVPIFDRVKTAEMMFEKLNVPSLCFLDQAVLSLFKHGLTTGISVDVGHGMTNFVPIQDGRPVDAATIRMPLSGLSLTEMLHSMVSKEGKLLNTPCGETYIQKIKETDAYVALDYYGELSKVEQKTYTLPDGKTFNLGKELIMCPEILFQPALNGMPYIAGIHKLTHFAINQCPDSVKEKLYSNIVLSGATCKLRNFEKRFTKELSAIISKYTNLSVIQTSGDPSFSVWQGGALQASADICSKVWIHKANFIESGPSILYEKRYRD